MVKKREIFIMFSSDDGRPRGHIWAITAKKTDFYLEFRGPRTGGLHLSMHGPNEDFEKHGFHVKINRQAVERTRESGLIFEHGLDEKFLFDGVQVADHAYRVARLRWDWDLQCPRFESAALSRVTIPELGDTKSGKKLATRLNPNSAWDIDLVVSYGEPYWPDAELTMRDESRLGPIRNEAGMWLTGTSYHRSQVLDPTPAHLQWPTPRSGETPQSVLSGGPGLDETKDMYWFVDSITSRQRLIGGDA